MSGVDTSGRHFLVERRKSRQEVLTDGEERLPSHEMGYAVGVPFQLLNP